METISINRDNIKIILSENDVRRFGLRLTEEDEYASRIMIREVLKLAFCECGFESRGDRLLVRMFPSKDGGCEFFVSRTGNETENGKNKISGFVCRLHDCESLYLLCERLKENGFSGQSELFCDENGAFILSAHERERLPSYINAKKGKNDFSFVTCYGDAAEYSENIRDYLSEHAKILCKSGAVERILG